MSQKTIQLPYNLAGWCMPEKREFTHNWFCGHPQKLIVEIGVYAGDYLIPMAIWAPKCPVVGIDPWDLDTHLQGQTDPAFKEWWTGAHRFPEMEARVRALVDNYGLKNVTLMKATSDGAVDSFIEDSITMLSVDGNHGAQVQRDVENYLPKVAPGGLIAMDDVWWIEGGIPHVQLAVDWLSAQGCEVLCNIGGCIFLQKWK